MFESRRRSECEQPCPGDKLETLKDVYNMRDLAAFGNTGPGVPGVQLHTS